MIGPVLWLVAGAVVAAVVGRTNAVAVGLFAAAVAFVVALLANLLLRAQRVREERSA